MFPGHPLSFDRTFWAGRRVLVTGHTGFKGSWLWLVLKTLGAEPHGLSLPPQTEPALFLEGGLDRDTGSRFGDIRDLEATCAALTEAAPEIVLHMAAQSLVHPSYAAPVETYATNVMGTVHVLEAVRRTPSVRAAVVVTSDKCYRNNEWLWSYRENEALGGHDPYSSSKACAEIVAESWRSSFFKDGAAIGSARAGNVIGGGDWSADRLIPDCARAFTAGREVELRRPKSVRPWQHVLEPLLGYLTLAQALVERPDQVAEAWNFGPYEADAIPVDAIVARFCEAWGEGARWRVTAEVFPHEAGTLRIDATKARELLGWKPRLDVGDAVAWSAAWYRRWSRGERAAALCAEQIEQYLARVES